MLTAPIETPRFFLRELTAADVTDEYLGWLRDQRSSRYIETAREIEDRDSLRRYVEQRTNREDVLFLGIFVKGSGLHIGNMKFEPLDRLTGSATMGVLIGHHDWRGKGVTPEALEACAQWLFEHCAVNQIFLGVDRDNTAGLKAYLKCGFRIIREAGKTADTGRAFHMVRRHSARRRIALGTVQFGLPYGLAKRQIGTEAETILNRAWDAGLDVLDTAIAYGESETRLGKIGVEHWKVISKLPATLDAGAAGVAEWVRKSVLGSLERLRISSLCGILVHRSEQLLGPDGDVLHRELSRLKDEGVVAKIGVSIYGTEELDALWPRYPLDIVQAPLNIVDRRLVASGWLNKLSEAGAEVHVRSAFLQGLLLMDAGSRPADFDRWRALWRQWHLWLEEHKVTAVQACLGFVLSQRGVDRVVVGVDSLDQLQAILAAADVQIAAPPDRLASEDLDLINPSRWSVH